MPAKSKSKTDETIVAPAVSSVPEVKELKMPEHLIRFKQNYRITLTSDMLGTTPKDKQVFRDYIAANALAVGVAPEVVEATIQDVPELPDRKGGETGFLTDEYGVYIDAYQFRGFLSNAANVLQDMTGIKNLRSKFKDFVFVNPKKIRLFGLDENGKQITIMNPDGDKARPIRGFTAQGPRVSITQSDMIKEGRYFDIEITILKNRDKIDFKVVDLILEYGAYQGLLQWRTGGHGQFVAKRVEHLP